MQVQGKIIIDRHKVKPLDPVDIQNLQIYRTHSQGIFGNWKISEMLQMLSQHIPQLEKLLTDVENTANNSILYLDSPNTYDVDMPLLSSYLTYWWQLGPDGPNRTT